MSYYLQFLLIPHGSSHVPHHASFIRSSYVHCTMFTAMLLLQRHITSFPTHKANTPFGDMPFLQAHTRSLGSIHYSSLLHFSKVQYTSLPILLCSPVGHRLRYGTLLAQSHAHASMPHKAPPLCAHHGLTATLLCAPVAGTRRALPFVPHSSTRGRLANSA